MTATENARPETFAEQVRMGAHSRTTATRCLQRHESEDADIAQATIMVRSCNPRLPVCPTADLRSPTSRPGAHS
jgi:hypothetical protein